MDSHLSVLLVEDSDADAELVLAQLARGWTDVRHRRVQMADPMRQALIERPWDIVVADYAMPGFSGIEALRILQESSLDIPLIIVSGTIDEETAVHALRAGAADFVLKDRLARLIPAIDREVREAEGRRERRAVEKALSDTRSRMVFAMEAGRVGIWDWDAATDRVRWSEINEELHGLSAGTFAGSLDAALDAIHPEDRERFRDGMTAATPEDPQFRVEYRTIWPDGSTHWIVAIGRAAHDASGQAVGGLGVCFDITARKTVEDQLRQTQRLESVGGLAAGVAHDFNNLLSVMSGYCELLAIRLADDAEAMADLSEIRHAAESAAGLTRQLLAFSRKQILSPRILDINDIIRDAQKMMRRLIEEHVRIDAHLAEHLSPVHVDPGQIEQVLFNLAINARDAMPAGGVITIETTNVMVGEENGAAGAGTRPMSCVRLEVSDTGTGMSPEVVARVFEPFFTTKERGRGTGLGLSTVFGIVSQSGGNVSVSSEIGRGTTFTIDLPAATTRDASVGGDGEAGSTILRGSETILVIEDQAPLRHLLRRVLQQSGFTVLAAADGAEARRLCAHHGGPIHVALMDVVIPGDSSRDVAQWLEQQSPGARVVYMSGYPDSAVVHDALLEPGTTFLQKPFSASTLTNRIREVLLASARDEDGDQRSRRLGEAS